MDTETDAGAVCHQPPIHGPQHTKTHHHNPGFHQPPIRGPQHTKTHL